MKEDFYRDLLFIHKIALSCDYFWPTYGERYEIQYKHLNKGLTDDCCKNIKPYSIIYADSSYLGCFNHFNIIEVPFILVSAESDYSIPFMDTKNKYLSIFNLLENKNLIRWYSVNVDFIHPKLVCIPIGLPIHIPILQNNFIAWQTTHNINEIEFFINNYVYIPSVKHNILNNDKNRELLYCKMTIMNSQNTNHTFENIRENYLSVIKKEFSYADNNLKLWTQYITELRHFKFCLSLPGKGLDCYRTWESLTVGVIPIVISSNLNLLYDDLPVVIINDVSEINTEFLNNKYKEICENINNYNWNKLSSKYWIDKIKSDILVL